ncbi:MAG TPA: hypothetical protein DDZ80_24140 [Cyanobacteria bacterium UBA8803]|nr:hypothetical protein [Cyanobacteria bacterium UBA9273]HBL61403.1 hypothetical protein [Cyanobacteria bacterium UBA8803]
MMHLDNRVNILLVDDQPTNLLALEAVLECLGQNLVKATSGEQALKYLLQEEFAVILLDVQMPGMDGFETAKLIRSRPTLQHTPIIFITAINREDAYVFKGYSLGAVDYLLKPIVPDILLSKVNVFLSLFKMTREVKQQAVQLKLTNKELEREISKRQQAEVALRQANDELEIKVRERTAALVKTNIALRESEQRLQAILDNSPAVIYLKDLEGRYILVNRQYEITRHLTRYEVIGKTDRDIFPPEIAAPLVANDRMVIEAGSALEFEEVIPLDDGRHTYIALKFPLYHSDGTCYGVCGISTDITKRIQTQEALRISEERFRVAIENSPIIVFNQDTELCYTWICNPTANYLEEDLIGKSDFELVSAEDAQRLMAIKRQVLATGVGMRQEIFLTVGEEVRYYDLAVEPLFNSARDVIGITCAAMDITEQKQAKEISRALEAEKELRRVQLRFFSMASHEFRTPLGTILGSAQILESCAQDWPESKRLRNLHRIKSAAKHLNQLLDDILTINRAETGKLEFNPQPLELEKFCQKLLEEIQINANSKHSIVFTSKIRNQNFRLDERLLRSILTNLLTNAIKYSPQGGEVHFTLTSSQDAVTFQIQDQGIGIPPEDQHHLLELFHRGKNVEKIPGTGLGLSVVKKCLDLQGGQISFKSEVGVGTTVTVMIPRRDEGMRG